MVSRAAPQDLAEILNVQKQAFLPVAAKTNQFDLPPLMQTQEEIEVEFGRRVFLKYVLGGRIVGSVRAHLDSGGLCQIGKLVVLPEHQNQGIGKQLMQAVHAAFLDCAGYELFTAEDNAATVSFYTKLGYQPVHAKTLGGVPMVFLRKENNHASDRG